MKNTMAETGSGITWGGAVTSVFGSVSQTEWMSIIGVLIALCGLVMNWYYKDKEYRLEKERHDIEKALLQKRLDDAEQD